jgi:uncharacterized protein DUF4192
MYGHTDSPADPQPSGAVRSFGELVSVVPLLLGFRPVDSLVLLTHTTEKPTVSGVIRVDLPAPRDRPAVVAQLCEVAVTGEVCAVTIVVFGGEHDDQGGVAHCGLVDALAAELRIAQITVRHSVWASSTDPGSRWVCYAPCRCGGAVPPMDTSPVATGMVVAGATTASSRDAFVATLGADPDDQLQRRAAMLEARLRSQTNQPLNPATGYGIVRHAIGVAATEPALPALSDTRIVELAAALADPHVRDRCLAITLPATDSDTDSDLRTRPDCADGAERLWTVLTRAVPAPTRAEPAVLLALHSYLRGRGVLAGVALDIAREANPNHALARLLHLALQRGLPPAHLHRLLQDFLTSLP